MRSAKRQSEEKDGLIYMFSDAYTEIRESTYVLIGRSKGGTVSGGTAFMIAPGVLATVAHVLYQNAGDRTSFQDNIWVMRDPEINSGQKMEASTVIDADTEYDIGLLRIENPRTETFVTFTTNPLPSGTDVGAVGYPLMNVRQIAAHSAVPLLRFQGGHVSASYSKKSPISGRQLVYHETDMPMYKGSSGCPGFLIDGKVFGMHVAEWHEGDDEGNLKQRAFSMWVPASAIISFARDNGIEIVAPS
jgi:S1-C subfamily serine protease